MKLQELLADRFARESESIGELRDRRGALLFEGGENRAPAIRQLVDGEDGPPLLSPLSRPAGEKFRKPYFA
ncbi:MAG TPA: hypothetical protein VLV78_09465 [Thermoanaerobaculia bacterium]|nr:hypothetical protein [Thermoanaerobaculia bacterium]